MWDLQYIYPSQCCKQWILIAMTFQCQFTGWVTVDSGESRAMRVVSLFYIAMWWLESFLFPFQSYLPLLLREFSVLWMGRKHILFSVYHLHTSFTAQSGSWLSGFQRKRPLVPLHFPLCTGVNRFFQHSCPLASECDCTTTESLLRQLIEVVV